MKQKVFLYCILSLSFVACKTTRIVEKQTIKTPTTTVIPKELYKQVLLAQPEIKTANFSRLTLELQQQDRAYSVKASIKLVVDKGITLSIQPALGYEVVRMEMTPDSVVIIDKINRRYFADSFSYFAQKIKVPVNFYNMQALLLDRLFVLGEASAQDSSLTKFVEQAFPDGRSLVLTSKGKTAVPHYFGVNNANRINMTKLNFPIGNTEFTCDYSEFKQEGEVSYPSVIKLNTISGRRSNAINMEINKADFNQAFELTRTNISDYTQVSFEQIMP